MGYISVQYNDNNYNKIKVTKRTNFYRKRKPLLCFFTFGNKNKNLYLPTVQMTIGRYQRTNHPIPITGRLSVHL